MPNVGEDAACGWEFLAKWVEGLFLAGKAGAERGAGEGTEVGLTVGKAHSPKIDTSPKSSSSPTAKRSRRNDLLEAETSSFIYFLLICILLVITCYYLTDPSDLLPQGLRGDWRPELSNFPPRIVKLSNASPKWCGTEKSNIGTEKSNCAPKSLRTRGHFATNQFPRSDTPSTEEHPKIEIPGSSRCREPSRKESFYEQW